MGAPRPERCENSRDGGDPVESFGEFVSCLCYAFFKAIVSFLYLCFRAALVYWCGRLICEVTGR
jgi:hypothetical protein